MDFCQEGMEYEGPKSDDSTPTHLKLAKSPDDLPLDVQEEIECLYDFVPEVQEHFKVLNKIGEGTFSSVFLARLKHYTEVKQLFALKHIIPTSHPSRIEGELKCLQEIGGCDNVMGVELCIRSKDHVVIVMPYFPHEKFQDYIQLMSVSEVQSYMRNLLVSLSRVHHFDVIHRDVKPSNFLYNRKTKQYALVDFGLAHKAPVLQKDLQQYHQQEVKDKKSFLSPSVKENIPTDISSKKLETPDPSLVKFRQYTPSPEISNRQFNKKKSPRRMLLAKRALMVKDSSTASKSNPGHLSNAAVSTCQCYGSPVVCSICMARGNQQAPRAGTPGFRSPEVLMKCPDQSTAVDIWSAGVILLSLLSSRYPFFRANDDMTALAQIISILGSQEVSDSAKTFGKHLVCSPATPMLDLKVLCTKLRAGPTARRSSRQSVSDKENIAIQSWRNVPDSAYDLCKRLMDLNPKTRITAREALLHPFLARS